MIDELLKEITELKEYKKKYENSMEARQMMSDKLYDLMLEKYRHTTYNQNVAEYKKHVCCDCRFNGSCSVVLPEDIGMPIVSDKAWIPAIKGCEEFKWD